ncbi:hypothetical protein V8E51_014295 [Hyaloscypha variabilis]
MFSAASWRWTRDVGSGFRNDLLEFRFDGRRLWMFWLNQQSVFCLLTIPLSSSYNTFLQREEFSALFSSVCTRKNNTEELSIHQSGLSLEFKHRRTVQFVFRNSANLDRMDEWEHVVGREVEDIGTHSSPPTNTTASPVGSEISSLSFTLRFSLTRMYIQNRRHLRENLLLTFAFLYRPPISFSPIRISNPGLSPRRRDPLTPVRITS